MSDKIKTETLPVNLTLDEKLDYAARAARAVDSIAQMQSEAKSLAAEFKERIKKDEYQVAKLSRCIRTGIDYREIEIREVVEHDKSHAAVYRRDTNKLVRTRPLTPDEMQKSLDDVWDDEPKVDHSIPAAFRLIEPDADGTRRYTADNGVEHEWVPGVTRALTVGANDKVIELAHEIAAHVAHEIEAFDPRPNAASNADADEFNNDYVPNGSEGAANLD